MSKRSSLPASPANNLFKYFARSPAQMAKTPKSDAQQSAVSPSTANANRNQSAGSKLSSASPISTKSAKRPIFEVLKKSPTSSVSDKEAAAAPSSDSDDDIQTAGKQAKKRRRIVAIASSDSEGEDRENIDKNRKTPPETEATKPSKPAVKVEPEATKATKATKTTETAVKVESTGFSEKLRALSDTKSGTDLSFIVETEDGSKSAQSLAAADAEPQSYTHQKLEFLRPANIKDAAGRRPNDALYDPTTLHVPKSYLDSLTPGMRQWWVLKSTHFDCVIFFKVGKFYELYHMDADVGVAELGFTYMRGEFAHSGFPEQSYDRMVVSLVERGFKVARTEQTETPEMMTERCRTSQQKVTKFDKVVAREVCQVTNRGTQVFGQQVPLTQSHQPNYMLAIAERHSAHNKSHRFGVCFIDTSIGEFQLGEFDDDQHCSRLLTLLAAHPPVLVLTQRGQLSERAGQICKTVLANTLREHLLPDSQFWPADRTLKTLAEKYFHSEDGAGTTWPATLRPLQAGDDHLGITAAASAALVLSALGACLWYLRKCLLDAQIMSQARFSAYTPPDTPHALATGEAYATEQLERAARRSARSIRGQHMVLDSISLGNLRIASGELSLLSRLDQCCTKFGRRLLQFWVCTPSCQLAELRGRQAAIRELMADQQRLQLVRELLSPLPDLERQLAQIHTFGDARRLRDHPDGRAILFEQKSYNRKKIADFVATLEAFEKLCRLPDMMAGCEAPLLRRLTQIGGEDGDGAGAAQFPDMRAKVAFYAGAFDRAEALRTGVIAPGAGVDEEFDAAEAEIATIEAELNDYLVRQERKFACRLVYHGDAKKRYQLEVPEANARRADASYQLEGQRKGAKPVKRYSTDETRELLRKMLAAEDRRNEVLRDLSRRMFERFAAEYRVWKRCVDAVAQLDVLGTLATYGLDQQQFCWPELLECGEQQAPVLELDDGVHPCLNASNEFIPNGVVLGGEGAAALALLTGPNMGGKSTMMRQVGLLVVMAQMGCPIPAVSCRMTLVDRIFTRLGAHDDIMAGHSTFLVELSETATILRHATCNSLVLLDELGRGTATYDGTAIAAAVVNFLAELGCRTMFSTHYHNLVENFQRDERISLGHMACMVENEGDTDDPTEETVTFLYKYTEGACPKSYGFNAAKLAGMPAAIIRRAHELSKKVEADAVQRKLFAKMLCSAEVGELRGLVGNLQTLIIK